MAKHSKDRRWLQAQIKRAIEERDFDRANTWLKLPNIFDNQQED